MRPIAPRTGAPEVTFAEDQPEWKPIVVATYSDQDGTPLNLMRWTLSADERKQVLLGADIYLMMVGSVVPHKLEVGQQEWMKVATPDAQNEPPSTGG